jgi:AraC-like DNA-binding protein/quercetin dioxygenase-like cupin family protein
LYNKRKFIAFIGLKYAIIDISGLGKEENRMDMKIPEIYKNISKAIDYGHTSSKEPESFEFHIHDRYEIYFFISGNVNYFIEKEVYHLKYGDLLLMNSNEIHKPYFKSNSVYERIVIHFDPAVAKIFSSDQMDLLHCFTGRPKGEQNRISLNAAQVSEVLKLFKRIENAGRNLHSGSEIIKLTSFIELLVFINRVFMDKQHVVENSNIPEKLVPIFDYINSNLSSDLSLKTLEQKFYMNRFYLSRLFKKSMGINIYEYVLFRRISDAKRLLADGTSVTETCQAVGFNDYSNFIRTFKRIVGVPPGQYRKNSAAKSNRYYEE